MSVSAGVTLVLLLSLVALYKSLAPIKTNNSKTVNATSKFALEQESGQGKVMHTLALLYTWLVRAVYNSYRVRCGTGSFQ